MNQRIEEINKSTKLDTYLSRTIDVLWVLVLASVLVVLWA
jgi:hypothetical protein